MSSTKYSNEMNAFRAGIENAVSKHKDKTDAVNQALGVKAQKVFQQGKTLADAGGKLLESGVGIAGTSGPLGAGVRKGITSFNKIKSAKLQEAQDAADKIKGKFKSLNDQGQDMLDRAKNKVSQISDQAKGKVSQATDAVETKTGDVDLLGKGRTDFSRAGGDEEGIEMETRPATATPMEKEANAPAEARQAPGGGGVEEADPELDRSLAVATRNARTGFAETGRGIDESNVPEQKIGENEIGGKGFADRVAPKKGVSFAEDEKGDALNRAGTMPKRAQAAEPVPEEGGATSAGEGAGAQGVGGDSTGVLKLPTKAVTNVAATPDGPSVQSGSNDAGTLDGLADTDAPGSISNATTNVVKKIGTSALIGEDLEEGAAATSWLGWLGVPEILAAAGAVAGVAGAVAGVVESVKGGNEEAAGLGMKTTAPAKTAQLAGSFVTPTQDSLT